MIQSFDPTQLSVGDLQTLLQNAVAPRPIAFASTIDKEGNPNLSPFSFFNVVSSNPPILLFSPARKGENGGLKDTYYNLKEVPEVVINVVHYQMVEQMSLSSVSYAKGVNEFEKAGLTPIPSEVVKPFRVKESPVQFECEVQQIIELGEEAGAGNLILCLVKRIHVQTSILDAKGQIDPFLIDLVGRMGGPYYVRTIKEALFEIPKPLGVMAMGIDQLPEHIKHSPYLTGNELARLGGVEALPTPTGKEPKAIDFEEAKKCIEAGNILEAFRYIY